MIEFKSKVRQTGSVFVFEQALERKGVRIDFYRTPTSVEYFDDGIVVDVPAGDKLPRSISKRDFGGFRLWYVNPCRGREIRISADNRAYSVNGGQPVVCPSEILGLQGLPDGEAVIVRETSAVGYENLYRYNWDGELLWHFKSDNRALQYPMSSVELDKDGTLVAAALWTGFFQVTLDSRSGKILRTLMNVK